MKRNRENLEVLKFRGQKKDLLPGPHISPACFGQTCRSNKTWRVQKRCGAWVCFIFLLKPNILSADQLSWGQINGPKLALKKKSTGIEASRYQKMSFTICKSEKLSTVTISTDKLNYVSPL